MVHAFPAPVRFSGISFSYNISYALFGGLTPMVVTLLMKVTPMAPSWYVLALMGVALGYLRCRTPIGLKRSCNTFFGRRA